MDIVRLLDDFNVDYVTEGHKHSRPGWVNVKCPFCTGHEGFHLGWNADEEYWFCWRCGWHPPVQTVSNLINVSLYETGNILKLYGINRTLLKTTTKKEGKPFLLPTGLTPLTEQHKNKLIDRHFDPVKIEEKWKVQSTSPLSKVGDIPYKHRIFIPYFWNGQLVTFDARDVTDKAENKYQACPVDREIIPRKSILYGNQEAWGTTGICLEGPTDVWRFGESSFATSGINFTPVQVRLMSKIFKMIFIVYDSEIQAQQQARKLSAELRFRGVKTEVVPILNGDPGSMRQRKADEFVKNLIG